MADRTRNEFTGGVTGPAIQAGSIGHVAIGGPATTRPAMLPPDVSHFTGRAEDLAKLDALLVADTPAVIITAIAGAGGMGKTSLAVHWSHRVRDRFPDGQLYVNLRGYDPSPPLTPARALDGFLRALGVPGENIPSDVEEMTGMFRSLVADRRMLILLDNAATPAQVRPLLPNTATCLVVVTSRSRLSGLAVRDGAHRIALDQLSPPEATTLLRKIVGAQRIDAEPEASDELVRRCAGMPLALRIVAHHVTDRPHHSIAELCDRHNLDTLSVEDDEVTAVRTVLGWSYDALPPETARVFRLLGLHAGPTISTPAVAALAGHTEVGQHLDVLVSGHLMAEIGRDRYQLHDLLRDYAAEQAARHDSERERTAARRRMLSWYLHSAHAARQWLHPGANFLTLGAADEEVHPLEFHRHADALRWFDDEHVNLVAATRHAADHGHHALATRLPIAMGPYQGLRMLTGEFIASSAIGLANARLLDDPALEAVLLNALGEAYLGARQFERSASYFHRMLSLAREIGNRHFEAIALHSLGWLHREQDLRDEAADHLHAALLIYRGVHDHRGEALMLGHIGDVLRRNQRFDEAFDYLNQSLATIRCVDNPWNEAWCLQCLARIHLDLRQFDEAAARFRQASTNYRALDDRHSLAETLSALGDTLRSAGQLDQARAAWREALSLYEELNLPQQATGVRLALDDVDG